MKIGINAVSEQDMHALLATVQAMSSDDLLLAISYSGERREINMAAGEALRVGCKILAITGFSPNALQQQATHCLYTIAEEQATRSAAISSTSAQMMLTDLLFMGLVQQDLERAPERIRHSEALVKKASLSRKWAYNARPVCVVSETFLMALLITKNASTAICASRSARMRPFRWVTAFMRLTATAAPSAWVITTRQPARKCARSRIRS